MNTRNHSSACICMYVCMYEQEKHPPACKMHACMYVFMNTGMHSSACSLYVLGSLMRFSDCKMYVCMYVFMNTSMDSSACSLYILVSLMRFYILGALMRFSACSMNVCMCLVYRHVCKQKTDTLNTNTHTQIHAIHTKICVYTQYTHRYVYECMYVCCVSVCLQTKN